MIAPRRRDAIQRQILSTVFPNPLDVFGGLRFAAQRLES